MILIAIKLQLRLVHQLMSQTIGILKPVKPHRDTWASNFQHQINWWIPLHDLSKQILFSLFQNILQKVKNNSKEWSFESFKKDILKVQRQSLFKILTLSIIKQKN